MSTDLLPYGQMQFDFANVGPPRRLIEKDYLEREGNAYTYLA